MVNYLFVLSIWVLWLFKPDLLYSSCRAVSLFHPFLQVISCRLILLFYLCVSSCGSLLSFLWPNAYAVMAGLGYVSMI